LKHFNKDWGNKAVMPKALGPFLHADMGIPLESATSITEKVAKIMPRAAFKIWTERNKTLQRKTLRTICLCNNTLRLTHPSKQSSKTHAYQRSQDLVTQMKVPAMIGINVLLYLFMSFGTFCGFYALCDLFSISILLKNDYTPITGQQYSKWPVAVPRSGE
jgi:hypothetical protein